MFVKLALTASVVAAPINRLDALTPDEIALAVNLLTNARYAEGEDRAAGLCPNLSTKDEGLPAFWHEMTLRPAFFFDRDPSMTFNPGQLQEQGKVP